ncbi:class I SAM-dependent methyltransferase [Candidatus Woesearchaeota archaeon]|nr:class I SAM-dependent methyltransferase [Candidatus Woesearchaeota archaeon]
MKRNSILQKWEEKWKIPEKKSVNIFAKRCNKLIKVKNCKTLIDIGCGLGQDALYFSRQGLDVTAVDFSEQAIKKLKEKANKKHNITFLCQDIKKLSFPENSFDCIYAHLSLHYFDDATTTKVFNNLYKLLKKEGILFIKCKSTDDVLYGKGEELDQDMFNYNGKIRHFFSKDYMKEKLKKFKNIQIRKTSSAYHKYKSSFIEAVAEK